MDRLLYLVIGFFIGTSATIFFILYYLYVSETLTAEIESTEDINAPDFTYRAGEGLEKIKKYGFY